MTSPSTEQSAEADRLEQQTPLLEDDDAIMAAPETPFEANEADVLEQSMLVPDDEDYRPG